MATSSSDFLAIFSLLISLLRFFTSDFLARASEKRYSQGDAGVYLHDLDLGFLCGDGMGIGEIGILKEYGGPRSTSKSETRLRGILKEYGGPRPKRGVIMVWPHLDPFFAAGLGAAGALEHGRSVLLFSFKDNGSRSG